MYLLMLFDLKVQQHNMHIDHLSSLLVLLSLYADNFEKCDSVVPYEKHCDCEREVPWASHCC